MLGNEHRSAGIGAEGTNVANPRRGEDDTVRDNSGCSTAVTGIADRLDLVPTGSDLV